MFEPTESETLESLDDLASVMLQLADQAAKDPAKLKAAPVSTVVGRVDEVLAAKNPLLRWVKP